MNIIIFVLDEETKTEVLAIRFANPENASKFKTAFDAAVISVTEIEATNIELAETQVTAADYGSKTEKENVTKDTVNITPKEQDTIQSSNESSKDVTEELKQLTVKEK